MLWVEGEGDRTRWVGGREQGDDGGRRGDALDVFHMVVFIVLIVVADLGSLGATWYGTIRIFRVGDILCGPRRERGMLDVLWPRRG